MATQRPKTSPPASNPSRRAVLKTGAKIAAAGLVTTVAARDARASGSWGGGNNGGGNGGGNNGGGNNGGGRPGRGRGRGR